MTDHPKLPAPICINGMYYIPSIEEREKAIADRLHQYYEKLTALGINEVNLIAIDIWNLEQELRGEK
jgi:hypothetical protein